jgi:polyphosphate kinase 2
MSNGSNKNDGAGAAAEAGSKPEGAEPSVAAEPQSVAGPRKPKLPKFAKRKTGAGAIVDSEVHVPNEHYDPALKARVAVWVRKRTLDYEAILELLQVELLKLQAHVKAEGKRMVLLFEGRDAAGKGGAIKRFTEHLNPRGARIVALEKPSDREATQWYFQRYVAHLPAAGEIVLFDRSWYNRAMVEPVMGFCTDEQYGRFMKDVPLFEQMLVKDGIQLFKFYFSVSQKEQERRFKQREKDLLRQYKLSPVDLEAQKYWGQYSLRKFQMLSETNRTIAPWWVVDSDDKKAARLNCIRIVLNAVDYKGKTKNKSLLRVKLEVVQSGIEHLKVLEETLMDPKRRG